LKKIAKHVELWHETSLDAGSIPAASTIYAYFYPVITVVFLNSNHTETG